MRRSVSLNHGLAAAVIFAAAASAFGQSEALKKAVELFQSQDYQAAQEALLKVDAASLTADEKSQLDQYLREVPEAINGAAKAQQDKKDGNEAYSAGKWDDAERLYRSVLDNKYASAILREGAQTQLSLVEEKRALSRAAEPAAHQESPAAPQAEPAQPAEAPAEAPAEPRRQTLVDKLRERDNLLWQRAVRQMDEAVTRARAAVAAKNFEEARQSAQHAVQIVESARAYAEPAAKYDAAKATALGVRTEVEDAYAAHEMERARTEREEIMSRLETRSRQIEQKRGEQIDQLFNSARQLQKEGRFNEAAEMMKQVLFIDPASPRAKDLLEVYQDYAAFRTQQEVHNERSNQMRRTFMDSEETKIPWQNEVLYPSNWLQLSARREGAGASVSGTSEENRELNRQLNDVIPEIRLQDRPFEDVVEYLRELKSANIIADWEDLELNGVDKTKTITIRLANVSFRTVLNEILTQAGGDVVLGFNISEGILRIATKEKLDRDKEVLVYDINDLLVDVPRFTNAAQLNPAEALNQSGQGGFTGGGGGGGNLFEQEENDQDQNDENTGQTRQVQEIIDIIRQTVEPDSWRDSGSGDGSIRELNGQLIVYNTSDAHQRVQDLLSQLREFKSLQVAIETRFLQVSSNFLEELGVDLDFVFNNGNAGFDQAFTAGGAPLVDPFTGGSVLVPRQFSRIGVTPATPGFGTPLPQPQVGAAQPYVQPGFVPAQGGVVPFSSDQMTPVPLRQGSLNLVDPANYQTGVPGSFADRFRQGASPALQIAGSFLDNLQVDFLIRATQANARSSVVQAPRLVLFNGQRANIFVGRTQTYVASLQPQVAQAATAFQPVPGAAQSGSSLDVEATISADRRYVTVTVRTTRAQDPVLTRFEVQRASGNSPGAFVTNVDQSSASVNTTVSIPDGGTVLLGGLKQVGEVEVDAGVPILSKIPVLKRAFTNTTTIKDTTTLLILIKAKIIIQKEAEEEAFPQLTASGG